MSWKALGEVKTVILGREIENFLADKKGVGRERKAFQAKGMAHAKFPSLESSSCLQIPKADPKGSSVKCWGGGHLDRR